MRRVSRAPFLGPVLLLLLPIPALSAPSGTSPPPLLTIVTESDDTLHAIGVRPAGFATVRIIDANGRYEIRSANRIRCVLDENGRDRTREALDLRRVIGSTLPGTPREPFPGAPRPVHYGPRSVTRTFMITETAAMGRLDPVRTNERSFTFSFDLGQAINITDHDALGASVFLGGGDGSGDLGIRARYRRWFSPRSCLDVSPGVILSHEEPGSAHGKGIGLVGQVSYTTARWVSVAAQVYSVDRSDVRESWYDGSYVVSGSRDTGVMFGVRLGGKAWIVTGAVGLAAAFVASGNRNIKYYAPSLP